MDDNAKPQDKFREEVADNFEQLADRLSITGQAYTRHNELLKSHANTILIYAGFFAVIFLALNYGLKKIKALEAAVGGAVTGIGEAVADVS